MGLPVLLFGLLSGAHPAAPSTLSERSLCALAEKLLVYAQPSEIDIACTIPFALTRCGREGLFSEGKPVFRLMLDRADADEAVDLLQSPGACAAASIKVYRAEQQMP